jgi:hypothetical protein
MIKIILYLILLAAIHAKLEIMIEGKEGWAKSLPCWRLNVFIIKLIIGKEITGYHTYLMFMFLLLFHSPFLFLNWTLSGELYVLGLFCIYWVLEDFLWFVENKHYGLKNFKKGKILWHNRWVFGLPVSYIISLLIGGLLLWFGTL